MASRHSAVKPVLTRLGFNLHDLKWAAAGLALILLGIAALWPSRGDDWRRTANGWERALHWEVGASTFSLQATSQKPGHSLAQPARVDSHPAVIALVELVFSLLGLYWFPFGSSAATAFHCPNWRALLVRSFRASAFG